ncbi:2-oxoglutarate-Fe(II)-dependent oxygenase superfamily protein [Litorimonas taeanensis]|uniref:2-oxoglutarate-Fe(II)-dependent oxygenase superfamily protein n=1 Tax=Litorimonas taeanensis TaxID=568099 RepID=A0A420WEG7_9PROT|nr:2OG-Fe(II) oxygenase [Litorimonas taeanensis]RKQ69378.1 2-oxoglutarate-Fe(II)-dependent oxygenase superfamily protein [Litorimonas taeanensis]
MLDFDRLENGTVKSFPFTYLMAEACLSEEDGAAVRQDYPNITKTGYLPLSKLDVHGAFSRLIDDLQSPRLAEILSDKLGLELRDKPRMITVRKLSKDSDGRIHNDSLSKICTCLIYLNETWDPAYGGAIRALNGENDMDDFADEMTPLTGNMFAFARSETSWHGHPPFAGERYVIQTTFLINEEALARKENRGGIQLLLKKLNPFAR